MPQVVVTRTSDVGLLTEADVPAAAEGRGEQRVIFFTACAGIGRTLALEVIDLG